MKKNNLNWLNKFVDDTNDVIISYMRGSMILNYVRSYFVVDWNTGLLYIFKKSNQNKPSRILHLSGGKISEGEQHFEDPINGEHIPSFELMLKK